MTADTQPVEDLEGRELDKAVAEEVMGWEPFDGPPDHVKDDWLPEYPDQWYRRPGGGWENATNVPAYSTDIAAAWKVWGQLPESWALIRRADGRYRCVPGTDYRGAFGVARHERGEGAIADTAPLAICHAALRAVRENDR